MKEDKKKTAEICDTLFPSLRSHILTELGARNKFRDNSTMSQSLKIVACCVVANFLNIVAFVVVAKKYCR